MSSLRGSIADRIYPLSTRISESGGSVRTEVEDPENRLRNSGCRHLLILVHGFYNSTSEAKNSYLLQLAALEEHFNRSRYAPDAIAFFQWPGDVGGLFRFAGYPFDIPRAKQSADRLAQYLKQFPSASDPGAFKISLIGHSLGCRLILEMLSKELPTALALNIGVVSLMAPAVPIELVDASGNLEITVRSPRHILKCYSRQDLALWAGFPQAQEAAYSLGYETEIYLEAVGLYGHPTAVGIPVETGNGHSDYWGDRNVANRFSAAIDPTFYTLPPPQNPANRALPQASLPGLRGLAGRD
jgi:pimeloyl-ACP methyl ester carboxylesterase